MVKPKPAGISPSGGVGSGLSSFGGSSGVGSSGYTGGGGISSYGASSAVGSMNGLSPKSKPFTSNSPFSLGAGSGGSGVTSMSSGYGGASGASGGYYGKPSGSSRGGNSGHGMPKFKPVALSFGKSGGVGGGAASGSMGRDKDSGFGGGYSGVGSRCVVVICRVSVCVACVSSCGLSPPLHPTRHRTSRVIF